MVKQLVGGGVISQWGVYCKRDPSTEMYPGEEGGGGRGREREDKAVRNKDLFLSQ